MASDQVIRGIQELIALEERTLLQQLSGAEVFVSSGFVEEASTLKELMEQEGRHGQMLVDLLDTFDATPGPRRVDMSTGELHFNELHVFLPRLIDDKKRLIAEYQTRSAAFKYESSAAEVVASILASHRHHLAGLESLQRPAVS